MIAGSVFLFRAGKLRNTAKIWQQNNFKEPNLM